jgi:SAM-dependent methyltransferase
MVSNNGPEEMPASMVRRIWDGMRWAASIQEPSRSQDAPWHVKCIDELWPMLEDRGICNALDAACGEPPSHLTKMLRGHGIEVVGMDNHAEADVDGDLHDIPFPDNSFDLVVARHCLEHVLIPYVVLRELIRVSRKYVLVVVPAPWGTMEIRWEHLNCTDSGSWERMMAHCGLELVQRSEGDFTAKGDPPRFNIEWRWLLEVDKTEE